MARLRHGPGRRQHHPDAGADHISARHTVHLPRAVDPQGPHTVGPQGCRPRGRHPVGPKAAAAETVAPEVVGTDRRSSVARSYVVKSGDTLAKIATAQNITGGYRAIFALNRATIENVNPIYPGEILRLR